MIITTTAIVTGAEALKDIAEEKNKGMEKSGNAKRVFGRVVNVNKRTGIPMGPTQPPHLPGDELSDQGDDEGRQADNAPQRTNNTFSKLPPLDLLRERLNWYSSDRSVSINKLISQYTEETKNRDGSITFRTVRDRSTFKTTFNPKTRSLKIQLAVRANAPYHAYDVIREQWRMLDPKDQFIPKRIKFKDVMDQTAREIMAKYKSNKNRVELLDNFLHKSPSGRYTKRIAEEFGLKAITAKVYSYGDNIKIAFDQNPGMPKGGPGGAETELLDPLLDRLDFYDSKMNPYHRRTIREHTRIEYPKNGKDGVIKALTTFKDDSGMMIGTTFNPQNKMFTFKSLFKGEHTELHASDVIRQQWEMLKDEYKFIPQRIRHETVINKKSLAVLDNYRGNNRLLFDAFMRQTVNGRLSMRVAAEFGLRAKSINPSYSSSSRGDVDIWLEPHSQMPVDFKMPSRDVNFDPKTEHTAPPAYEMMPRRQTVLPNASTLPSGTAGRSAPIPVQHWQNTPSAAPLNR